MRQAARVDTTQAEIVAALRRAGAWVLDLSRAGQGVPDLYVAYPAREWAGFLECKSRGGRMTPAEVRFVAECPVPVRVVYSAEDALRVIGAMQ